MMKVFNGSPRSGEMSVRNLEFSAYRFHEDDPIFFSNGLRLTCRNGEKLNGHQFHDTPEADFTTYVWLYQW